MAYIVIGTLKMVTIDEPEITFDQTALSNWVEACNADGALRASGASQEELAISHMNVIIGLANLIAPFSNNDIMGLVSLLMLPNSDSNTINSNTINSNAINQNNIEVEDPNPLAVDSTSDNEQNN